MSKSFARRRTLFRFALAAPLLSLATQIRAQSLAWPEKPIKLVLGYPTGGAADGVARQLQAKLEAKLGQSLIFDYRPGAGAAIAAEYVARATPDGYTLHLVDSGALTILPNVRKLSYDPLSSFTLIGSVAGGGSVLVAHPSVPVDNVPKLISMLKGKPGAFAFGTSGGCGRWSFGGRALPGNVADGNDSCAVQRRRSGHGRSARRSSTIAVRFDGICNFIHRKRQDQGARRNLSCARRRTSRRANLRGAGPDRLRGYVLVRSRGAFKVGNRSRVSAGHCPDRYPG